MRGAWIAVLVAGVLACAAGALGCGKSKVTEDWSGAKPAEKKEENPPPKAGIKPVGRVLLTEIAGKYEVPDANRAAIKDKYFGKYWEIDLEHDGFSVEEDHLAAKTHPATRWVVVSLYFRDNKDLLKFGIKDGKQIGPKMVIGRAVSEKRFEDCYIP